MTEVYTRYHNKLLALVRTATEDSARKAKLRGILAEFGDDYRLLSPIGRDVLRNELAGQIDREAPRFSDPDKRAVLTVALNHINELD